MSAMSRARGKGRQVDGRGHGGESLEYSYEKYLPSGRTVQQNAVGAVGAVVWIVLTSAVVIVVAEAEPFLARAVSTKIEWRSRDSTRLAPEGVALLCGSNEAARSETSHGSR
jgi:hypothetical protein